MGELHSVNLGLVVALPCAGGETCAMTHCCTAFKCGHGASLHNPTGNQGVWALWVSSVLYGTWMAVGFEIWDLPSTVIMLLLLCIVGFVGPDRLKRNKNFT